MFVLYLFQMVILILIRHLDVNVRHHMTKHKP